MRGSAVPLTMERLSVPSTIYHRALEDKMRREFRGQVCAYCRKRESASDDHIIGKGFIPDRLRGNLPKVPSCLVCNGEKADLERYAMALFPFGATDPVGTEMLHTKVGARLGKDKRLLRELREGQREAVAVNPDGTTGRRVAIPVDPGKSFELFRMLVLGLVWHHNRSPLPPAYAIRLLALTARGREWFQRTVLTLSPGEHQRRALAGGAFSYQFTRNAEDKFFSAWVLDIYGTLNIVAPAADGTLRRVFAGALTGPPEIGLLADQIEEKGSRTDPTP